MKNSMKAIRCVLVVLCELLTVVNVIRFILVGNWNRLLLSLLTLILILIPDGIERLFHCYISQGLPMYVLPSM